ncbi:hypothetical protein, partial [Nigerium sp.]|uniref:hypothetical protein n=1 Tax=Nigerium sp. TaxID=2042655 RepID=UPI0032216AAF
MENVTRPSAVVHEVPSGTLLVTRNAAGRPTRDPVGPKCDPGGPKRCRSFVNAAGVLETPGDGRNAAVRKAAFSPEAGVNETLQAFR